MQHIYRELEQLKLEELVQLVQDNHEESEYIWYLLEQKTENTYHYVFNKYVHEFYKTNMKEDIYSTLKIGWVKAVKTFNPNKTTVGFIPFVCYVMWQHYRMFVKRIHEDRIGRSVRDELFSSAVSSTHESNDSMLDGQATNILRYECREFDDLSEKDYFRDKFEILEEIDPLQYAFVKAHCMNQVTQKQLGKDYNMSQSAVSRKIKKGLEFLKEEIGYDYY